jgi:hypothetical protein
VAMAGHGDRTQEQQYQFKHALILSGVPDVRDDAQRRTRRVGLERDVDKIILPPKK